MRLLLVEDDRALMGALQRGLSAAGFAADVAPTAAAAEALAARNPYDLVVLDLGLPDADGTSRCSQTCAGAIRTCGSWCSPRAAP